MEILWNRRNLLANKKLLGQWGERRSERLLKKKGLKTLTRNFSCKTGELDLVMVDTDRTIVFVEVRTKAKREHKPLSGPEETVTYPKRLRLLRTARYFLAAHKIEDRPYRFDIVAIVLGQKGRPQIRHYENAFVL
jgi:putative endonuclease